MAIPGLFLFILSLLKHQYNFYNKQIHLVCCTGIRTHDLLDMSLLP